jgi:predicted TIM-barrel fold metal-dependent hydrolase
LPPDYLSDSRNFNIEKTVYVEAEWDPRDPLGEMRYIEQLRRAHGLPTVAVAQAWLHHADVFSILESQSSFSFVRSIRHKPPPGAMLDPAWRRGFAALARNGLRFDLQTPWSSLDDAARLAGDFPDTQIILNHTGLPADRSAEGIAGWMRAMKAFAARPNTVVKISGLGQKGMPWSAEANRPIVLAAIEIFGVERCMVASNFPVDGLCGTFRTIFDGFFSITAGFSERERKALFHDNAIRIYGMTA